MQSIRSLFKRVIGKTLTHRIKNIINITLRIPERFTYLFSTKYQNAYTSTKKFIYNVENYQIDLDLHKKVSERVIDNFKKQMSEDIDEIFSPGIQWANIIREKKTFKKWEETKDDSILKDKILDFHRNDLITSIGDSYKFGSPEDSSQNLRRNVYKTVKTYDEFVAKELTFDPNVIGVSDVGRNPYVIYGKKKLTLQFTRHAYYLNRMKKFGILNDQMLFGELGSGAGGFVITAKRLFPKATFICFDLPATLLISSYNVIMNYPELKIGLYDQFQDMDSIRTEDLENFDVVMLPNWCIEKVENNIFDVFYNLESLSEMDMEIIKNYLDHIERTTKKYFYTVNRNNTIRLRGAAHVPPDDFPFSLNTKIEHAQEDKAIDYFHQILRNRCHYKELLVKYNKGEERA
jgi:putative sugar O-methyltransferase